MGIFTKKEDIPTRTGDFGYLKSSDLYFDSACQTLRPRKVIEAQREYFEEFNACGGRVKYAWGEKLDGIISKARKGTLAFLGLKESDYETAFTLNTTYGINLIIQQLKQGAFQRIVTSEIEHNSVFLPTISAAKRLGIERRVLPRAEDGALVYKKEDIDKAVVVLNSTSNLDGRNLTNLKDLLDDVHKAGGIVILDGAQTMGHSHASIKGLPFDALAFSAHKMYGPSLGVLVFRKDLLGKLENSWVGGGTVSAVHEDSFELISSSEDASARFEAGLQNFSGIVGYKAALDWLNENTGLEGSGAKLGDKLFKDLSSLPVQMINKSASPIISFNSPKIDSHRLALFLSENGMMARSGYFCCHYYLIDKLKSQPLLRVSLGANNTEEEVDRLIDSLSRIFKNI